MKRFNKKLYLWLLPIAIIALYFLLKDKPNTKEEQLNTQIPTAKSQNTTENTVEVSLASPAKALEVKTPQKALSNHDIAENSATLEKIEHEVMYLKVIAKAKPKSMKTEKSSIKIPKNWKVKEVEYLTREGKVREIITDRQVTLEAHAISNSYYAPAVAYGNIKITLTQK